MPCFDPEPGDLRNTPGDVRRCALRRLYAVAPCGACPGRQWRQRPRHTIPRRRCSTCPMAGLYPERRSPPASRTGFAGSPLRSRAPFDFPLTAVTAVHFSVPAELPGPEATTASSWRAATCLRLAGRHGLKGGRARDRTAGGAPCRSSAINRMYRWRSSADLIYLGPNGLAGWQQVGNKSGWKEEQGQPWTESGRRHDSW